MYNVLVDITINGYMHEQTVSSYTTKIEWSCGAARTIIHFNIYKFVKAITKLTCNPHAVRE